MHLLYLLKSISLQLFSNIPYPTMSELRNASSSRNTQTRIPSPTTLATLPISCPSTAAGTTSNLRRPFPLSEMYISQPSRFDGMWNLWWTTYKSEFTSDIGVGGGHWSGSKSCSATYHDVRGTELCALVLSIWWWESLSGTSEICHFQESMGGITLR